MGLEKDSIEMGRDQGFCLLRVFVVYPLLEGLNRVHNWKIAVAVLMNTVTKLKRRNVLCKVRVPDHIS